MPSINNLVYTDKFKKWFDTTNTIITTLNGITVYNILEGDGISLSSSGNVFTVNHAKTVATGVTFTGNVNFTGSVNFATAPTTNTRIIVNVSPKVDGITAGKVVRLDSTGLTLARANSAANSEVLGVVVTDTDTSHVVAVSGLLDNTSFANTILNAVGTTLIAGEAYFLDSVVPGGITTNEPTTYGHVSKPILLGITGNSGNILTYRGILLEGISYGITAELDNKIIIEFDTNNGEPHQERPIKIGDPFLYFTDSGSGFRAAGLNAVTAKWTGKVNNSVADNGYIPFTPAPGGASLKTALTGNNFLGLVSEVISETSGVYILEITLPGGTVTATVGELDSALYPDTSVTTPLSLSDSSTFVTATTGTKFLDFIKTGDPSDTVKIVIARGSGGGSQASQAASPNGITSAVEYYNLIPNGAFTVWQRPTTVASLPLTTSYTTDYLMQPFNSVSTDAGGAFTNYTYRLIDPVADRWFAVRNLDYLVYTDGGNTKRGLTGGSSIFRRSFSSDQIEVPGSPLYYLDCVFNYALSPVSTLAKRPRLENIHPNARLAQGQTVTFSFWGKSTVSGSTLDVIYNQYKPNYPDFTGLTAAVETRTNVTSSGGGVTLTTAWKQYAKTFTVNSAGFTLADDELGWFGIGFEFPSATATISLAQAQLHLGNYALTPVNVPYHKELERCREVYQTNFLQGITYIHNPHRASASCFGSTDSINKTGCSRFAVSALRTPLVYPTKMVITPKSVAYFSPDNGAINDAFIVNLNKNASTVSGSDNQFLPWQDDSFNNSGGYSRPRSAFASGSRPLFTNEIKNTELEIFIPNDGKWAVTYFDTIMFNYILDADITSSPTFGFPFTSTTLYY